MLLHLAACACYFLVDNVTVLLLVRFIHGLGYGGAANIILTIGMSILPKSRYGEASGYFMLAPTLAIASGPYAGAYVYDTFGPTGCFIMTIIFFALMLLFILAMNFKEIDPGAQKTERQKPDAAGLNRIFEVKAVPISFCMFTIVLCAIGCGLGYGTLNSCCNSIACRQASPARRSYAVSTFWVFCDGGMGMGPAILGAIAGATGYTAMYYVASGVTLVALPIYHLAWGRHGGKSKKNLH